MAYPTVYARQFDFQSYQNANPTRPLPGDKVNADLNEIVTSIDEIVTFLQGVTRADGELANGSVTVDTLDTTLAAAVGDLASLAEVQALIDAAEAASTSAVSSAAEAVVSASDAFDSATAASASEIAAAASAVAAAASAASLTDATTTVSGKVELATDAEAIAKTDTVRAITPSNLAALGSSATFAGLVELATDAEAVTGTDTARAVTAANVTARLAAPGAIGGTTPAAATFTTVTLNSGQLVFPAAQNASANANTLDDYEEGTWTPILGFATNGDLARSYTTQSGDYTKIGRHVFASGQTLTSAFTHTTASGQVQLSGLPFACAAVSHAFVGATAWTGITKVGFTQVGSFVTSGASVMIFFAFASANAVTAVNAADMPSGGTVNLSSTVAYHV